MNNSFFSPEISKTSRKAFMGNVVLHNSVTLGDCKNNTFVMELGFEKVLIQNKIK